MIIWSVSHSTGALSSVSGSLDGRDGVQVRGEVRGRLELIGDARAAGLQRGVADAVPEADDDVVEGVDAPDVHRGEPGRHRPGDQSFASRSSPGTRPTFAITIPRALSRSTVSVQNSCVVR